MRSACGCSFRPRPSWAAIRDKLAFGALDAAHLLGPMPIALAAGLGGVKAQVTVAAGLGANGNTITLSNGADAGARPLHSRRWPPPPSPPWSAAAPSRAAGR